MPMLTSRRSGSVTTSSSSRTSTSTSRGASPGRRGDAAPGGPGQPAAAPFPGGLEFALSGFRELDGMIEQHAALAAVPGGASSDCPSPVQQAVGASYEQWDGQGWPGELRGDAVPVASRLAQLAEYVEVAHRIGGIGGAVTLARGRSGTQFDPSLVAPALRPRRGHSRRPRHRPDVGRGHRGRARARRPAGRRAARRGAARRGQLRRPEVALHARARPRRGRTTPPRPARQLGWPERDVADAAPGRPGPRPGPARRVELDLGQARARWARANGSGCACTPTSPSGCCSQSACAGAARRDRGAAPRAPGRLGLPARPVRRGDLTAGSRPGRGRRLPVDARAAAAPRRARPAPAAAAELRAEVHGRAPGRRRGRGGARRRPGHRVAARRREGPRRAHRPRSRRAAAVARGLSSKQIAQRLVISPKTARNHIEHIYVKIGASSRAAASLFAMRHGLLPEQETAAPDLMPRPKMGQSPHAA